MLRDDKMFPMATRLVPESPEPDVDEHEQSYPNDDFDDVFGSEPPSPTLEPHHDSPTETTRHGRLGNLEPSDVPRLKEKHETEGYRDGVTQGKAKSIQAGFDEGYNLGAVLGLRIGKILGLLEGIVGGIDAGFRVDEQGWRGEKERVEKLWVQAKEELATVSVFGKEYWGEDGIWKFEVPGEKGGGEVVFPDVADAHPLLVKWWAVVGEECERWGVDLNVLEVLEEEGGREGEVMDEVVEEGGASLKSGKHKHEHAKPVKESTAEAAPASAAAGKIMGVSKDQLNW